METTANVSKGDWVSFMQDRKITIGQVEYVKEREAWQRHREVYTTVGIVSEDLVLEVRVPSGGIRCK